MIRFLSALPALLMAGLVTLASSTATADCIALESTGKNDMAKALANLRLSMSEKTNVHVFGNQKVSQTRAETQEDIRIHRVSGGRAPGINTYIKQSNDSLELCAVQRS